VVAEFGPWKEVFVSGKGTLLAFVTGIALIYSSVSLFWSTRDGYERSQPTDPSTILPNKSVKDPDPKKPDPVADPDVQFTASERVAFPDTPVVLQWSVKGAVDVQLDGMDVRPSGSFTVFPQRTTVYRLIASHAGEAKVVEVQVEVKGNKAHSHGGGGGSAPIIKPTNGAIAENILAKLKPGEITYDPPQDMKVAASRDVHVRIGRLQDGVAGRREQLEADLVRGLDKQLAIRPKNLSVSTTMKALLTGTKEDFQIDLKSPEEQIVDIGEPTEWRWVVTPLRSGKHKLHLSGIAIVKVEGIEKQREFSVYDTDISVRINLPHYVGENWKEISGAVSGTGVVGWLVARWKKRRTPKRKRSSAHA
jgi:hypothetical protein